MKPLIDKRTISSPRAGPGRSLIKNLDRLQGKHFGTGSGKGSKRGRCKVCANHKKADGKCKDTKTANQCERCQVFLCPGKCFAKFHAQHKY